jgi:hypothetical protein
VQATLRLQDFEPLLTIVDGVVDIFHKFGGPSLRRFWLKMAAIDRIEIVNVRRSAQPGSILASVVNKDVVRDVATRFAGHVVATIGSEAATFHEVDFLGFGCAK